ncbi:hypothetical protein [Clostridium senegalense]|uniref:Uncharacterized protein n=1 Tax=Clostridium senegalense TaxID=1465809 RepID=A0A6M0H5I0_9CLOT|nr:hypothetical protein [Clostridium senegalense]NEU04842.1 hypothetical protein [Clostridium senegalense]
MSKEQSKSYKVDSIKRFKIFMFGNILLATILGVFAQDIAYYISDNINIVKLSAVYCLTALTLISILLFLITPILICRCIKKQGQKKGRFIIYIFIDSIIGILTSTFSMFVMIMWWG